MGFEKMKFNLDSGPVDSESEEEKCVHLDLGQSEESDEEEDDKKKLVLMGFEKMKFNLDSGPVDSESEEEKCVHLDLGQSEESDEEEDDKKKLVLMGFEKMKFNLDSTEFEALWKEMQAVERLQLYADLFEHLAVLHEVGVIHCDLKPDNIMNIYADSPKTIDADSGDITQADNSITTIKKTSLIEGKEVTIRRIPFKFIDFGLSQARNLEGNQDPICHFSNPTYTLPMINQKGGLQRMKGSFVVQDIYSLAVLVQTFENPFANIDTSSYHL